MRIFWTLILFMGLCHGVSKATECTSYGRFPNNEAEDCRGYTVCLIGGLANFTQYKLTCPVGFVYSHFEQQCTNATGYRCYDSYNCSVVGNFSEPNSEDCRSFVACIQGVSGTASARLFDCPQDTLFNASNGQCVNATDYNCIRKSTVTNITGFLNASVILYDFSSNTNNVRNDANFCKKMSVLWFLIIFLCR